MRMLILAATAAALTTAAQAATITQTETLSPVLEVDNSTGTATTTVAQSGTILDVDFIANLTGSSSSINNDGSPNSNGSSAFFNELFLSLESPEGTSVALIPRVTYTAGTSLRFTVTLDDEAADTLGGAPATGSFQPVNALSAFDGEDAAGIWTVTIGDRFGGDPKSLNAFTLEIETAGSTVVPVPAALPLLAGALGLLGLAARRGRS